MPGKTYTQLQRVTDFFLAQSEEVNAEYALIVKTLEENGRLEMPFGEPLASRYHLHAIRIIKAGNIRVFYVYGKNDRVFGLHAYVKKTQQIPVHERKTAQKLASQLKQRGLI